MNKTYTTIGKIVLGTVLSVAMIMPVTTSAYAATTTGIHSTAKSNPVGIEKGKKVVAYAKSLMGKVSYQWGKKDAGRLIFDCSSFTQYVYSKYGVHIKWGANAAYAQGTKVAKVNLRVGDLVYFSVGTPGKIGHVGIYMGNGKFIHNLNPKSDVTISDLTTGYWKRHYVAAARYF